MSKISYCSLEEAWGDLYVKNKDNLNINNNKSDINDINDKDKNEILNNINITEKNNIKNNNIENNGIIEYQKYRFNPINKVNNNNDDKIYSPFQESIEKKYLQDKINFLENEFKKYKNYFETQNVQGIEDNQNNTMEYFTNKKEEDEPNNKSNDIIDLLLLIIIGLIIIFVMNSIFNIGKSIGSRNKI